MGGANEGYGMEELGAAASSEFVPLVHPPLLAPTPIPAVSDPAGQARCGCVLLPSLLKWNFDT